MEHAGAHYSSPGKNASGDRACTQLFPSNLTFCVRCGRRCRLQCSANASQLPTAMSECNFVPARLHLPRMPWKKGVMAGGASRLLSLEPNWNCFGCRDDRLE